tara:strand:+ start:566 stop:772 length:207 start_codon:yes stop_codon:yes gene_type:complete
MRFAAISGDGPLPAQGHTKGRAKNTPTPAPSGNSTPIVQRKSQAVGAQSVLSWPWGKVAKRVGVVRKG